MYEMLWVKGGLALFLTGLSIVDLKRKQVPRLPLVAVGVLGIIGVSGAGRAETASVLIALLVGAAFLWLAFVTEQAIGYGDVATIVVLGLYCGIYVLILSLMIAFLAAFLVGMILWITKRKGKKDQIPFLPFLTIGYVVGGCLWT
ncbi:MAG: prepilin peptidase [Lachnospiraceae bacterium]|nr:prepilin peptidase [Lachnospiraceae bacterium]